MGWGIALIIPVFKIVSGNRLAFRPIGMAVLIEGVLPMLPATLSLRRFSPELAPLLIAAGMPLLRPNPHSEAFLKLLLEEISKSSRRK